MNMSNKLLGYIFKNKKAISSDYISVDTLSNVDNTNIINNYTAGQYMAGGIVYNTTNDVNPYGDTFTGGTDNQDEHGRNRINDYRTLMFVPEVSMIVNEVVNESIASFGRNKQDRVVELVILNEEYENEHNSLIQKQELSIEIEQSFNRIYDLLNIKNNGANIFKQWLIDGQIAFYVHLNKNNQICDLELLETKHLQYVKEIHKGVKSEYYIYNNTLKLSADSVIWVGSGYLDQNGSNIGYLENAIKFANMLRMFEDSMLIYRVSRSPERRVFYIDTGDLPKAKAEQYVKEIANRYKTSISYDTNTGKLKNKHNNIAITEDFWLARGANGNSTSIETLPAGNGGNDTTELDYFKNKLYDSLRVPQSRFNREMMTQYTPNTQISREELRFYRLIHELRNNFNNLFLELMKVDLILSNVIDFDVSHWKIIRDNIDFKYFEVNYFQEELESEKQRNNINTYQQYVELIERWYISKEYFYIKIMKLEDEEIQKMMVEIGKNNVNKDDDY